MMKSGRWAACAFALGMLQAFLLPSVCAADDVEFYHDRDSTLIGQPAPKLPAHLAGSWGTNESLFAGTASQAQLYLAPDGLGVLAASSSAPVPAGSAPATSGPAPRAIIGFPVQAELDKGGLRLQVLMPQKTQLQEAPGMVFVCSYDAAAPMLTCTGPNKDVLRLARLSEKLSDEAQTQLEQLRTLQSH
ncbi:hypothetical protein GTP23_19125 [Pseudoduganella sp. FT93W]|uniref:Uncharacterized protein n=1 Tax=Duganella fentianensis TaxID=2692177 RepID=A0A845I6L8_9BURK|nr:hypothetical protein [Duganella fentianensis]MYN47158.1 hypothetical protein [Duganella fentianensis]